MWNVVLDRQSCIAQIACQVLPGYGNFELWGIFAAGLLLWRYLHIHINLHKGVQLCKVILGRDRRCIFGRGRDADFNRKKRRVPQRRRKDKCDEDLGLEVDTDRSLFELQTTQGTGQQFRELHFIGALKMSRRTLPSGVASCRKELSGSLN